MCKATWNTHLLVLQCAIAAPPTQLLSRECPGPSNSEQESEQKREILARAEERGMGKEKEIGGREEPWSINKWWVQQCELLLVSIAAAPLSFAWQHLEQTLLLAPFPFLLFLSQRFCCRFHSVPFFLPFSVSVSLRWNNRCVFSKIIFSCD